MSNLTLIAPFQTLSLNEVAQGGWTHKVTFTMNDCNAVPSATTGSAEWNLMLLGAGYIVQSVAIYVVTPFVFSNASIVIGELQIGDGAAATTYFATAANQKVQGTGATSAVAAGACYITTTTTPVAYAVATNAQLNMTMTVTTSQALNTATAGEVDIFFKITNLAQLAYPQSN
jgi:hypothetical protein